MAKKGTQKQVNVQPTLNHWTREMSSKITATEGNTFPPFDVSRLTPLMPDYHVWDNWFILDEDGKVADIGGYRVLIALVRPISGGDSSGERIAYFYSNDNTHYTLGGFLFETQVYDGIREWSGSTILRNDGKIQTFYTISQGLEIDGVWQTGQRFATAIQPFEVEHDVLTILPAEYHALLKEPDGRLYETAAQASKREHQLNTLHNRALGSDQTENFCFRDPKFFKDPKTKAAYIIFEGNTGSDVSPSGSVKREYIGADTFEPDYTPTIDDLKANGCVGVIELMNDDYTYGEFRKPWLTANLVTDEIERINVITHDGAYYLFVAGHGNKNTMVSTNDDLNNRDYMLGFRAKSFLGKLEPLNGSGVVVQQKSMGGAYAGQETNQQYVYSWLVVPTEKSDVFDVVSYANFSMDVDKQIKPIKTSGPTVELRIDGLNTHITKLKYNIIADNTVSK